MTKQETFDAVVRHLLTQAKKSVSEAICMYRGPGGAMCAAGALIPEDKYSAGMEGTAVCCDGFATYVGDAVVRLGHDLGLVADLQDVHDVGRVDSWPRRLCDVAAKHDLSAAVVDEMEPSFRERISAKG